MSNDTAPATETQQQPTARQTFVRIVAAMIEHNLPAPKSIGIYGPADEIRANIRMQDDDIDGLNGWSAALGTGPIRAGVVRGELSSPFAAWSEALRVRAYVTVCTSKPDVKPEPPLTGDDAKALATIQAEAADKPWFDDDAPRTWRWDPDAPTVEPEGVAAVLDDDGDQWTFQPGGYWEWRANPRAAAPNIITDWTDLLRSHGPLTEVVPPAQGGAR